MPTPTYIPLATYTVTGATLASVTFTSIPQTYRDLVLVVAGRISVSAAEIEVHLNGATTGYTDVDMVGFGSGTPTSTAGSKSVIVMTSGQNVSTVQIMDYSATDKHKTMLSRSSAADNRVRAAAVRYASTSAITQIKVGDEPASVNLLQGTTISLYGVN